MEVVHLILIVCQLSITVALPLIKNLQEIPLTEWRTEYRAAVYEHVPIVFHGGGLVKPTPQEAKGVIRDNLAIFQTQVAVAASEGVDIIVFPEYGLWGLENLLRGNILPFLETVPDPAEVTWNPCEDTSDNLTYTAQIGLSCMARLHSMYVVANMGDVHYCDTATDPSCPSDGRYQFNTNVVFDPEGQLVSRYHKETLYYEYFYDEPLEVQHSTFVTPFGTFGNMVCFDVLFKEPGVTLAEELGVDSIVFPTAWSSKLPLMQGLGYHEAWAHRMGVNMLSSELHQPSGYFTGSGIYSGADGALEQYLHLVFDDPQPALLISTVPTVAPKYSRGQIDVLPKVTEDLDLFHSVLQSDNYTFVLLESDEGNLTISLGEGATCNLVYRFSSHLDGEVYALGMYDGLHYSAHNSYLQVCVLLKCADPEDRTTCGHYIYNSASTFDHIQLTGQFQTVHIFPELVVDGGYADKTQWKYEDDLELPRGMLTTSGPMSKSLLVAGLYGRKYEWDTIEGAAM